MRASKRCHRAGYSLVELMIGMTILASLTGAAVLATNNGIGSYESTRAGEEAQTKLHRAANRVVQELMGSSLSVLGPAGLQDDFGSSTLEFQLPLDIAPTGPIWGATQTITGEYAPGEIDDGIDNNGNGLIDEGILVLTRDAGLPTAQRVVLCSNLRETFPGEIQGNLADDNGNAVIDETGFNAIIVDDVLTLRFCIEVPSFEGTTVVRELTTSTRMRN